METLTVAQIMPRVRSRIQELQDKIKSKTGYVLAEPKIGFLQSNRVNGRARLNEWKIELNIALLSSPATFEKFVNQTLGHEICHLWAYGQYKDNGHGPRWQQCMRAVGLAPMRCSSYGDADPRRTPVRSGNLNPVCAATRLVDLDDY